jgi:hypothetical protein
METFREKYLEKVRLSSSLIESAKSGRLPAILNDAEIGVLICDGEPDPGPMPSPSCVFGKLRIACLRGELKATLSDRGIYGNRDEKQTYCYIHRDDARRYFAALEIEPETGGALWCWLRGKTAEEAGKLKPDQQDKADFQKLCLEIWGRNPTMTITGEFGVTKQLGETLPYHKSYKPKTLEGWAREVAPDNVKNNRGRRPKISVTEGK